MGPWRSSIVFCLVLLATASGCAGLPSGGANGWPPERTGLTVKVAHDAETESAVAVAVGRVDADGSTGGSGPCTVGPRVVAADTVSPAPGERERLAVSGTGTFCIRARSGSGETVARVTVRHERAWNEIYVVVRDSGELELWQQY